MNRECPEMLCYTKKNSDYIEYIAKFELTAPVRSTIEICHCCCRMDPGLSE